MSGSYSSPSMVLWISRLDMKIGLLCLKQARLPNRVTIFSYRIENLPNLSILTNTYKIFLSVYVYE